MARHAPPTSGSREGAFAGAATRRRGPLLGGHAGPRSTPSRIPNSVRALVLSAAELRRGEPGSSSGARRGADGDARAAGRSRGSARTVPDPDERLRRLGNLLLRRVVLAYDQAAERSWTRRRGSPTQPRPGRTMLLRQQQRPSIPTRSSAITTPGAHAARRRPDERQHRGSLAGANVVPSRKLPRRLEYREWERCAGSTCSGRSAVSREDTAGPRSTVSPTSACAYRRLEADSWSRTTVSCSET